MWKRIIETILYQFSFDRLLVTRLPIVIKLHVLKFCKRGENAMRRVSSPECVPHLYGTIHVWVRGCIRVWVRGCIRVRVCSCVYNVCDEQLRQEKGKAVVR